MPTIRATGRELAERFLTGTPMTIDLTDDAFAMIATPSEDHRPT